MPDQYRPAQIVQMSLWLWCALLVSCNESPGSPEVEVRAWVANAAAAAEKKDRRALMAMISANYIDARGNEQSDINNLLRLYFLRQKNVAIVSRTEEVKMLGSTAAAVSLTAGMAGTNMGAFGVRADAYRFILELEHDGDEWLLLGARWAELGEEPR